MEKSVRVVKEKNGRYAELLGKPEEIQKGVDELSFKGAIKISYSKEELRNLGAEIDRVLKGD